MEWINKIPLWVLGLSTGLLLFLGWPMLPTAFVLFVAFVPLLMLWHRLAQSQKKRKGWRMLGYSYLAFFSWNLSTTWWVWNASPGGATAAILANSFLMALTFSLAFYIRQQMSIKAGWLAIPLFWLSFEYLHFNWDLTWPWLTLGHGFAVFHRWIQWYEFTGVLGGTLWIWVVNLLVAQMLIQGYTLIRIIRIAAFVLVPILFSAYQYYTYEEKGESIPTIAVQPNIDPYKEKFPSHEHFMPYMEQLQRLQSLTLQKQKQEREELILWPETALVEGAFEDNLQGYTTLRALEDFAQQQPEDALITGANTYVGYGDQAKTATTRHTQGIGYYDAYNTALFLHEGTFKGRYHKSKLVPGVERMPYPSVLGPLASVAIDLGGISGSLGTQKERTVFSTKRAKIAPVICYESIFGEFCGEYINKGAKAIAIITNDAWWGDTPGYKQHCAYAKLLAIEHRRSIARSANTGISCFINQRGDIRQATTFWEPAVIEGALRLHDQKTIYTYFGDWLGRIAGFVSPFLLIGAWVNKRTKNQPKS